MTGFAILIGVAVAAVLCAVCYVIGYDHGSNAGRQIGLLQATVGMTDGVRATDS